MLTNVLRVFSIRKNPLRLYIPGNIPLPFDAVVVPGVPFKDGKWDSLMKARVVWSYILYKNGYAKNIIYSGAAVYTPYIEAGIMGLYAQKLGIPEQHIFFEMQARHSTENVYFSYLLAKNEGFKSIALATDPFQSYLLKDFLKRRFETPIYRFPYVSDMLKEFEHTEPAIDPRMAHVENFTPLTSQQSFVERMKGTMGKDIDWDKHKNGILPRL